MDSPSVMSTCDRIQVTHMFEGLGRIDVPQRQQRLFGGLRKGMRWLSVECPSCFVSLSLFLFSEALQTQQQQRQQHSHMAHGPLRDERRGRGRAVKHHKEKKRKKKSERKERASSGENAAEFFFVRAALRRKGKKRGGGGSPSSFTTPLQKHRSFSFL